MERARDAAPAGIAKVLAAAEFAAFKHREQRRKGVSGSPYINHPLAVASRAGRPSRRLGVRMDVTT